MTRDSIDNGKSPTSEFGGLDEYCDSSARCSTSLFRLLCDIAADAFLLNEKSAATAAAEKNDRLTLWSNRPGQNASEANALALLSIWLTGGIVLGAMVHLFGRAWWVWLVAVVATPVLTFLALQLFSGVCALSVVAISKLGVIHERARERSVLLVNLAGLTLIALLALRWGDPFFLAASVPWLLWAALNFLAWVVLLLRSLATALRQLSASDHHSPPPND